MSELENSLNSFDLKKAEIIERLLIHTSDINNFYSKFRNLTFSLIEILDSLNKDLVQSGHKLTFSRQEYKNANGSLIKEAFVISFEISNVSSYSNGKPHCNFMYFLDRGMVKVLYICNFSGSIDYRYKISNNCALKLPKKFDILNLSNEESKKILSEFIIETLENSKIEKVQ